MKALELIAIAILIAGVGEIGAQNRGPGLPAYSYRILRTFPHDRTSFTQGLIYLDGSFYESTGLTGSSKLRRVQPETGKVLQEYSVPKDVFAEGMTNFGPDLFQLTWMGGKGYIYDRATFKVKRTFMYKGEGWGLTQDGARLILSDGSANLRFFDPKTLAETGRIAVRDRGQPVMDLNELEYVRGEIYANVWHADRIARISPKSGDVLGWIDLSGLQQIGGSGNSEGVLNGIAYDAAQDRLFVTGKLWTMIFEIKVIPKP